MTGTGSPESPLTSFSWEDAQAHWETGNGATVYVDMSSHMASGGGIVFSARDFATPIGNITRGLPVGTVVNFETNAALRSETGAYSAVATHNFYGSHGILSDQAYVWGNTSAGFRGTVTVLGNGQIAMSGEIRPYNEQFDFSHNTWNPMLEAARAIGAIWAGPGTAFDLRFVGSGMPVNGTYQLHQFGAFDRYNMWEVDDHCFPAFTPIAISLSETRPISDIRVGDTVLAFDPAAELGRGALVPRKVVRLYRNTTEEWVKLTWAEGGEQKELIATPGHHFLDRFGSFPTIEEMLENGKATVVLASGALTEVTAERITYRADTAHLFEQAEAVGMVAGNAALKPAAIDAWQTYNFEVEDLHTYVAGGVRVHNRSGFLGRVGNTIDDALDRILGGTDGDRSVRDKATDIVTSPLHVVGEVLSTVFVRKLDREVAPKHSTWVAWCKSAVAMFLGAGIMVTSAHADTVNYFEKWTKSEGFDVGYACNWWKDVPGPESMFQVKKLKSAEILADTDSAEFRMIKPYSAKRTFDNHDGSLFDIRLDREIGTVRAIRILYPFGRNGYCGFVLKDKDGSPIEILRGSAAPTAAASRKAMRWIERTIADCHRRLRKAIDPNLLFDCVSSIDPNSNEVQPSEGLRSSVMPEGVVPASVARIYLRKHGDVFAITVFGESVEVLKIGEQE